MATAEPALPESDATPADATAEEAREGWMDLALADGCSAALAAAARRGRVPIGPRPEAPAEG